LKTLHIESPSPTQKPDYLNNLPDDISKLLLSLIENKNKPFISDNQI